MHHFPSFRYLLRTYLDYSYDDGLHTNAHSNFSASFSCQMCVAKESCGVMNYAFRTGRLRNYPAKCDTEEDDETEKKCGERDREKRQKSLVWHNTKRMKRKTAEENISKEMIDEQKCGSKQERNRRKGKKKKIGKKTAYEFLVLIRIVQCYFGIFFSYFILSLFLCMASGSFCWESHLSHTSTYSIICAMCIRTKHLTSVYISELETLAERDSFFFCISSLVLFYARRRIYRCLG